MFNYDYAESLAYNVEMYVLEAGNLVPSVGHVAESMYRYVNPTTRVASRRRVEAAVAELVAAGTLYHAAGGLARDDGGAALEEATHP
jgi:hypothetical protein